MKINIINNKWKIKLLRPEKFIKLHGDDFKDSAAVTDTSTKEVFFRTDHIDIVHVRHELFHCYFAAMLIDSLTLDRDNLEELSASIVGEYAEELVEHSKKVFKFLNNKIKKKPSNTLLTNKE